MFMNFWLAFSEKKGIVEIVGHRYSYAITENENFVELFSIIST